MAWRPPPDPLTALERISSRVPSDGERVMVIDRPPPRRRRVRLPLPPRRPAWQAEPSRRSPDRAPQALITTTPSLPAAPPSALVAVPLSRPDVIGYVGLRPARALHGPDLPVDSVVGPMVDPVVDPVVGSMVDSMVDPVVDPVVGSMVDPVVGSVVGDIPGGAVGGLTQGVDSLGPLAPPARLTAANRLVEAPDRLEASVWGSETSDRGTTAAASSATTPTAGPRLLTVRQVLVVLLVCLGLWTLVDASALARSASHSHAGTRRSVALAVLDPIRRVAAALGMDRIDHWLHPAPPLVVVAPPTRPHVVMPSASPPVTVALAPLRVPTIADPMRVLVVGDSLGLTFGQSLATKLDGTGLVNTTVDAREGTGLARPDAFDWMQQLRADIVRFHPEIVVASFGGNDDQDVQVNGRFITFGSPAWEAIYRGRVRDLAALCRQANVRLLWSGLPVMRSDGKTARLAEVMRMARSGLAPPAVFVDNFRTLADAGGHYQVALPDSSGNAQIIRQPDGIHETPAGAGRLADRVIAVMRARWNAGF